jgi:hypothetical protein
MSPKSETVLVLTARFLAIAIVPLFGGLAGVPILGFVIYMAVVGALWLLHEGGASILRDSGWYALIVNWLMTIAALIPVAPLMYGIGWLLHWLDL